MLSVPGPRSPASCRAPPNPQQPGIANPVQALEWPGDGLPRSERFDVVTHGTILGPDDFAAPTRAATLTQWLVRGRPRPHRQSAPGTRLPIIGHRSEQVRYSWRSGLGLRPSDPRRKRQVRRVLRQPRDDFRLRRLHVPRRQALDHGFEVIHHQPPDQVGIGHDATGTMRAEPDVWARREDNIPADRLQLRAVNLRSVPIRLNRRNSVNPSCHKRVELVRVGVGRAIAPCGRDVEFLSRRTFALRSSSG